jgi:N-acetylneuraminate synthase
MLRPELQIADRAIGSTHRPFVIAEVGINHDGDFDRAVRMFHDVAQAGGECVKIQSHIVDDEMIPNDVVPGNADEPIWDMMQRCALSSDMERELKGVAENLGLIFLSTPFSRAAADNLDAMGVDAFKVGSGECNNYPLVDHIASLGRPMIVSTGMNDLPSIAPTVAILRRRRVPFALLHCTSLYPTPYDKVRLGALAQMAAVFPDAVLGLSDHSPSIFPLLGAVPLGAAVLERHFTSDPTWDGPDVPVSMTPDQLQLLIGGADAIHASLGGTKEILPEEQPTIDFAYASVVTIAPVAAGEELTRANLWVKRPGTGEIRAADYERVLGRRAATGIPVNAQVRWQDLS